MCILKFNKIQKDLKDVKKSAFKANNQILEICTKQT